MAEKKEKDGATTSQRLAEKIADRAGRIKYIILGVLAVAAVIVVAIALMRHNANKRHAASESALYKAKMEVYTKPESDYKAILGKVATDYAGLPAGADALMAQFSLAAEKNDFAAAEKFARDYLKTYPDNTFAPAMRLALAQVLMNDGRVAEARPEIEAVAKLGGATYPEAALTLAQLDEREADAAKDNKDAQSNQLIKARDAYTTIRSNVESRTSYWPQPILLVADFSLLLVNDRLAGYQHPAPILPATTHDADGEDVDVGAVAAPPADDAAPQNEGGVAAGPVADKAPEAPPAEAAKQADDAGAVGVEKPAAPEGAAE